ncbi:MAG: prevent-host-death protein [Chthonomonadaceae bacterium]|nr:prevent-host-death protein [Chthonomonadaceae bacterium]
MLDLNDIHSLSEFQRNTREFLEEMKRNRGPVVLTVNGKAAVVVQDAQSYQEIINRLERAEAVAAIRRGMNDFENGNFQDAEEAFADIRQKHGIPR